MVYQDSDTIIQILEYLKGPELFMRILEASEDLTEFHIAGFIFHILTGLEYLHARRIVHLDLKPENIVCTDNETFNLKIIDFGLARRLDGSDIRVMEGTADFVSPEVVKYESISTASDMWSLGVVAYILLTGLSPFLGDSKSETFENITSVRYTFEEKEFDPISESCKHFISSFLHVEPSERLSANQALNHPWILHRNRKNSAGFEKRNLRSYLARTRWIHASKAVLHSSLKDPEK
ncbi:myosin light chain kinase, smooth muscle [Eurytemora carolleeae]|uniref:myosin light chain kinase, smooth muscle n=1 Tax=Eurytemora carolleeae TaxID=1294199 RepID=UPI000C781CF5|nr:myosin light chain kinase, smooth muscle [Eurytemora carolleeae]|eukprot:XP_023332101.1 myosin light chain kinase, smooth muscle-like [Eurytemora affinis]